MRAAILLCLGVALCGPAQAQRNNWKPKDFQPLTELPWKDAKATMEEVMERIFRETNLDIRYPVLGDYLRHIDVADLGKAFDLAVTLEGTQTPDELVPLLLYVWAQRDPVKAWERTKSLFRLVGLENGWLNYAGWEKPKIEVQDHAALQKSRFWLSRQALVSFATGCNDSELPMVERAKLLRLFADEWFGRFETWPEGGRSTEYLGATKHNVSGVIAAFEGKPKIPDVSWDGAEARQNRAAFEIASRRRLAAHPELVTGLIKTIEDRKEKWPDSVAAISTELLLVWHRVDLGGLTKWASARQDDRHREAAVTARCILISEVEPKLRQAWLKEMLSGERDRANLETLAAWEPQLAMESAPLVKSEWLELNDLVDGCAYGPFRGRVWNASHSGFGYLVEHGLEHLSGSLRKKLLNGWFESTFMEQWGDLDVGEAARFGVHTLLKDDLFPRKDLFEIFEGRDSGDRDDGLVDRSTCALRVWAVVRPEEMRAWIKTVVDDGMRKALTWTLEHPWGTGAHWRE